ncbi:MAG TPA: DUF1499 domain-containing protein [Candidatus Angelobacter sp.]|nr:DUF1499 domain-containing protein [Candidatus Angelobacter sp.]
MGALNRLFETHVESRDNHPDPKLKTRYFKTSKSNVMDEVRAWIESSKGFELLDVSEERGELAAKVNGRKKGLLVLTVITVRPFRTAIDLSFTVDKGLNRGYGQSIYQSVCDTVGKRYEAVSLY